jgi:hypothetical protein
MVLSLATDPAEALGSQREGTRNRGDKDTAAEPIDRSDQERDAKDAKEKEKGREGSKNEGTEEAGVRSR